MQHRREGNKKMEKEEANDESAKNCDTVCRQRAVGNRMIAGNQVPPTTSRTAQQQNHRRRYSGNNSAYFQRSSGERKLSIIEQLQASTKVLQLVIECRYPLTQINGQRRLGPPPDWTGPAPGSGCEIFVGKIPRTLYEHDLYPLFRNVGEIYEIRLMMDYFGMNRGYCFIMYTKPEYASRAVKELNLYEIRPGRRIGVVPSINNCRLFISQLPAKLDTESIIKRMYVVTADVEKVAVYRNFNGNVNYALVSYKTHRGAAMARKRLMPESSTVFPGTDIIVDWALPNFAPSDIFEESGTYEEDGTVKITKIFLRAINSKTDQQTKSPIESTSTEKLQKEQEHANNPSTQIPRSRSLPSNFSNETVFKFPTTYANCVCSNQSSTTNTPVSAGGEATKLDKSSRWPKKEVGQGERFGDTKKNQNQHQNGESSEQKVAVDAEKCKENGNAMNSFHSRALLNRNDGYGFTNRNYPAAHPNEHSKFMNGCSNQSPDYKALSFDFRNNVYFDPTGIAYLTENDKLCEPYGGYYPMDDSVVSKRWWGEYPDHNRRHHPMFFFQANGLAQFNEELQHNNLMQMDLPHPSLNCSDSVQQNVLRSFDHFQHQSMLSPELQRQQQNSDFFYCSMCIPPQMNYANMNHLGTTSQSVDFSNSSSSSSSNSSSSNSCRLQNFLPNDLKNAEENKQSNSFTSRDSGQQMRNHWSLWNQYNQHSQNANLSSQSESNAAVVNGNVEENRSKNSQEFGKESVQNNSRLPRPILSRSYID